MEDLDLDLIDTGTKIGAYTGKRPVFLTVICILTFVGVGLSFIYSLYSLYTISMMENVMGDFSGLSDDGFGSDFENYYKWSKVSVYVGWFGNLSCLAGAIIMMKLRKFGYYFYIIGQVLPLIASFLVSSSIFGSFGGFGLIWMFLWMIFPVGFIIMYGLNYKYMR